MQGAGGCRIRSRSVVESRHGVHKVVVEVLDRTDNAYDLTVCIITCQSTHTNQSKLAPAVHLIPGVIEGAGQAQTIRQTGLHTACDVPEGIVGHQHEQVDRCILAECSKLIGVEINIVIKG